MGSTNGERSDSPLVYVILVNWNGYRDTIECLESILRLNYRNFRIVVCDNDSSDGSVQKMIEWAEGELPYALPDSRLAHLSSPPVPKPVQYRSLDSIREDQEFPVCHEQLVIIQTGANLGFAGGNNVGIKFALSQGEFDYIWFLNNDTVIKRNSLKYLVELAREDISIGMIGATICYYDRPEMVQALGGAKFSKFAARSEMIGIGRKLKEIDPVEIKQTEEQLDWISGASMFVSSDFISFVGSMEEGYFLYFEELDWALRAKGKFKMTYAPKALVYHKHGGTTGERSQSDTAIYFRCRSRLKLYRKLLPAYLPFCFMAIAKEALFHLLKGNTNVHRPMWQAITDEISG